MKTRKSKKRAKSFFFFLWVCYIKTMRIKSCSKAIFILCLTALLAIVGLATLSPNRIFALSSEIAVKNGELLITGTHTLSFPNDNKGTDQVLSIKNHSYDVENGKYTVQYSYIRTESKTAVFTQFGQPIELTTENPNAEFSYNFFAEHGVGTYRIKAVVLLNNKIVDKPAELRLIVQKPSQSGGHWNATIRQEPIGTSKGDFAQYAFYAEVRNGDNQLDLTKYEVQWYVSCNDRPATFCGSGNSIKWSASEAGMYQMQYTITELGISCEENIGNMTKNYTHYAIYALIATAGVITIIVIITTIRKVKNERVW